MGPNDPVELEGIHFTLRIERPGPGVVVLRLRGRDVGELAGAPFRELERDLEAAGALTLFIDARQVRSASVAVSNQWALWLRKHRARLAALHFLAGSRFIRLTADLVRRFSELGARMHLHTDAAQFEAALSAAQSASCPRT